MEIYRQNDSRWGWMPLGHSSPYKCRDFGSEAVAIAQALTLGGWAINPYILIGRLVDLNGFTDESDPLGPGLVKYEIVQQAYPQFIAGEQGYSILGGNWGRFRQHILQFGDSYYDPFYGLQQLPQGFFFNGYIRTAKINPPS